MSFTSEFLELQKKKKKKTGHSFTDEFNELEESRIEEEIAPVMSTRQPIAPVKEEKEEKRTWFDSGAFSDGYDFGDVAKTILGTGKDIGDNALAGILGMGEALVDTGAYIAGGVGGMFGADEFADDMKDFVKKDLYNEKKVAESLSKYSLAGLLTDTNKDSLLGDKTDSLLQSGGQLLATAGLQAVGVPWFLTTGLTSFGGEAENAFNQGADYGEAGGSALISAGAEILTEKLSGGISFGGKTLDDVLLKPLVDKISSKTLKTLVNLGIDAAGEGAEEVISSVFSNLGSALYKEESIGELLLSEQAMDEYLESFIGGAALGGGMSSVRAANSIRTGRDYKTGLTDNEQSVVDKVYEARIAEEETDGKKLTNKEKSKIYDEVMEDLKEGGIDIETINDVLGGDSYKAYKEAFDNREALKDELKTLREMESGKRNDFQEERLNELKGMNLSDDTEMKNLRDKYHSEFFPKIKDSYLAESFYEDAKTGEKFTADVSKYKGKQAETIQRAIDSGILNNTRRTHKFVDMLAKVSADKGVLFDFTDNDKLKKSGFAVNGSFVNGYYDTKNKTVGVNIDSKKALNTVVGHEITHVLEGTDLWLELESAVTEYAKSVDKDGYNKKLNEIIEMYRDVKDADPIREMTADLVGDYLFTDTDFVNHLSTKNRNVFQKLFDEIKYLCKVATAGSKEARQLEKVKRAFEKAYREGGKTSGDTKYSLTMVDAVKPTNGKWSPGASTDEVRAAHPTLYAVDEDATEQRNPTQVKGTVNSYRKIYDVLEQEGFNGTILDASSGLGYGTKAGVEEYGFNVEDIEPYPDSNYKPKYTDYSSLDKSYDVVISNAVLNVLPQDQRDALTVKMGELLNPGGRMFVNVRGKDVLNASGKIAINESNMEYFIPRTAKTGSYQKGFTQGELVAYLEDALGKGFTVEPTRMFGAVSAIVTKDDNVKYSLYDSDGKSPDIRHLDDGREVEVVNGIAVAPNVATVIKSNEYSKPTDYMTKYSLSTMPDWEKSYLEKHNSKNDLRVVESIRSFTEKMVQDDAVRGYVPTGEYKYTKMGPLRSNQEYVVTFDMDTSCPRTFQFLNFRDAIQRKSNRYLTYNESINLLELMRAYGQQIPCCYCYVENKRVLLSASYNNFFGFRNAVMTAKTDAEAAKAMYGYSEKKGLPEASKKALARWRSDLNYNPSVTEVWKATNTARNSVLNYLDAQMETGKINPKTAESKLNNMVLEQFGIKDKGAIAEVQTFVKDWTYDTLANIPHIYNIDNDTDVSMVDEKALALNHEALAYSKSASSAKSVENYVPYTDQLKNVSKEDREYIMGMGGIRKHSSNDFRMDYVQDYFLFYADLAADEWTGHTYTKSADFTKIFACTNDRINMSVAFYEDADGTLRENIDEGASWKDVRELRKAYKNVGSMAMVTSDNQLSYALNSDWVDMIIPFHASGLDKSVWYNLRMWNDYTAKQGERFYNADTMKQKLSEAGVEIPKGANATQIKSLFEETFQVKRIYGKDGEAVKPHFFPGDTYVNGQLVPGHHNDAETYFRLCEEYGVHPRFYGIKVTDTNGNQIDVTEHPSYLKLIKETSRTDSAQETIQFNFGNYDAFLKMTPFEYAMKRLQEEANNGGFENTKADPYGVVDEFINEYLDKDRPLGYLTERAKETREILLEMSKENAAKQAEIVGKEVDAFSLSAENEQPTRVRGGIYGEDVKLKQPEVIAPMGEDVTDNDGNIDDFAPIDESKVAPDQAEGETNGVDVPIITTKQKLSAKIKNAEAELEKKIQARNESNAYYDSEISRAKTELDAKKNKNTKAAQALSRRIDRLTRLKGDADADFQKRINDLEKRVAKLNDQYLSNHDRADNLERYKKRESAKLEAEKGVLAEEFNQRRANLQEEIGDKDSFISNRAYELYKEISNLKKGVRASKELGYILDHGYEWKSIKTALINAKNRPNQVVNTNSVVESTVREMLNAEYEDKVYELDEIDNEYNEAVAKLEEEAAKRFEAFKVANQRNTKQQEYSKLMENLVGDTTTWVDKKLGLSYKVNTLRRNLRDIVRDENGNQDIAKADAIYDELQGKYNHNEAKLNRETNQIKKPFAEMELTKAEDAYIQMLGEFNHNPDTTLKQKDVDDFYNSHKDSIDVAKVTRAIEMARETYDNLLERVNEVLREQGMKEIPYRKGYFPHFTEDKQSWLAKLLNWKTQNNDIPTDIAGLTEQFNPNRSWQSFNKQRKTDTTDYSFSKGFDTYVQGALDWIYHIEDIQKRRALENHIRYVHSEKGVQDKIDAIRQNDQYDADEMQEQIDLVYKEAGNPLNNFVTDLRAGTNRLANKKSSLDRGMEEMVNRKVYSTMTNLSNRVTANQVVGSVSSALTNFIPITQSWGQVSPLSSLRAMKDTIASAVKDDGTVDKSDFLTNRLNQAEMLYKTTWDKIGEGASFLMNVFDNFTSQTVWRSKYIENINNGMSESAAIKDADQFAENVIAGRSRGNNPTIFDSKNPLIKTLTAFQLEVNNQYGYMFKDMPQDLKSEGTRKLVQGYATMFLGAYVYNALYSSLTGRDAAFDPIGIIKELLGDLFDDDEEETDALMNLVDNVVEEVPFVGGLVGGGRIPISSAMPYGEGIMEVLSGTVDDIKNEDWGNLTKEWLNPLYYLVMPMGGGQIKKTVQGLSMFSPDHPVAGSYTDSGSLRFPVEKDFGNVAKAGIFGQWANENAQTYLDEGYAPLDEKRIQEYIDSGMSINDYWEYRKGLKDKETLGEKVAYIYNLDLPIETKNILVNNLADREEPIDLSDFGEYDDWGEFEYAHKYPDKYAFLEANNISVEQYKNFDEDTKGAWSWAYQNPEKFTLSKAVSNDLLQYRQFTSDLNDIKADKDENGKSISGSRKEKVIDYVNNLDVDYGIRLILFKSEYKADDTYNYDIIDYLNSREDISYEDMETILKELGFDVDSEGNITWD